MTISVPIICAGALALLLFALSIAITGLRLRSHVLVGAPDDPTSPLTKLVRAQANTAEYAAVLLVLFLWLDFRHAGAVSQGLMILAVVGRYLFAAGMLLSPSIARPNPVRAIGAAATYAGGVGLSIALLAS